MMMMMMILCRGVSTAEQKRRIVNQLTHIDKMLKEAVEARPTWLIVAGHYPVYSIGTSTTPYRMNHSVASRSLIRLAISICQVMMEILAS
jgi:hypothetical protein